MTSTLFTLMAEFETGQIEVEKVARKFMGLTDKRDIMRRACEQRYPFPVFRVGSQKSPWLVSAADLAEYLDKCRDEAAKAKAALE